MLDSRLRVTERISHTVIAAVQLDTQRNPIVPPGGIDSNPLRNDGHLEAIIADRIGVIIALEHLHAK